MDRLPLPIGSGSYILILFLETRQKIQIGKAELMDFPPGYYLYTGSALGKGGIIGRLRRHLTPAVKMHWHIDYLRRYADIVGCGWVIHPLPRECDWIEALSGWYFIHFPAQKFGSCDCRRGCPAHLAHVDDWEGVKLALELIDQKENKQQVPFYSAVLDNHHGLC